MQRIDPDYLDENGGFCPVCETGPKLDDGGICDYCGWENDGSEKYFDEIINPDRPTGMNGKWTFNKFKEEYKRRIKKNPKYVWSKMQFSKEGEIKWN